MSEYESQEMIGLLACPECGGDLQSAATQMRCGDCGKEYDVRDGIPCLYPSSLDEEHLREEQSMAEHMLVSPTGRKEQFVMDNWAESKKEFWQMVSDNVGGHGKTFVNLGCGYDTHCREYDGENIFINFDLVYDLLHILKSRHGAKSCVAGDINKLPFKKQSFDYAISIDVIHHESEDLEALIETFADLLKPGGRLFLEDANAWGLFQIPKSILMPRWMYRLLRKTYHQIRRNVRGPTDYEFPTNVWKIKKMLKSAGFSDIVVHPNHSYPTIGPGAYQFYKLLSGIELVKKYHSYHYMISARKGPVPTI